MELTAKVLKVITTEGISPGELVQMIDRAAFTRLRGSNRRYHMWVFRVVEHNGFIVQIADMQYADLVTEGTGPHHMLEEHAPCEGAGCHDCGWVGSIARAVDDATARELKCS